MSFYDLYKIDGSMAGLVDDETGEVLDYDKFLALSAERDEKIEGAALSIKNLRAKIADMKAEEDALAERRHAAEKQAARLEGYLSDYLAGEKFESARCRISYRRSAPLEIADEAAFIREMQLSGNDWALTFKPPVINKSAVKEALASGWVFRDGLGVRLADRQNIQIK